MKKQNSVVWIFGIKRLAVTWILTAAICALTLPAAAGGNGLGPEDFTLVQEATGRVITVGAPFDGAADGLRINRQGDRVVDLTVSAAGYSTGRGIKTGDSLSRVTGAYGEPVRTGESKTYKWIGYEYEDTSSPLKIFFYLDKETDLVIAVNINLYPVGAPPLLSGGDNGGL